MTRQKPRRQRSFQLTPTGWLRLEQARREQMVLYTPGEQYTLETLSAKTGLDRRTVAKVLDRKLGVDKRTLEQFIQSF